MKIKAQITKEVEVDVELPAYRKETGSDVFWKIVSDKQMYQIGIYEPDRFDVYCFSTTDIIVDKLENKKVATEEEWLAAINRFRDHATAFADSQH